MARSSAANGFLCSSVQEKHVARVDMRIKQVFFMAKKKKKILVFQMSDIFFNILKYSMLI